MDDEDESVRLFKVEAAHIEEADGPTRSYRKTMIAKGWISLGSIGTFTIVALAVAHYAFGMPVHYAHIGNVETEGAIAISLLVMGGGSALFLVLGILLHRRRFD